MIAKQTVYLLLGSNLGDRLQVMHTASELIGVQTGGIVSASSVYETAPWGVLDQPSFLNRVLEVETEMAPEEVLRIILDIEHELGRIRYERWGARVIDIDILYFANLVLDTARLTIPHPRLHERRFTLAPLVEIAPTFIHPVFNKTSQQLMAECSDTSEVTLFS